MSPGRNDRVMEGGCGDGNDGKRITLRRLHNKEGKAQDFDMEAAMTGMARILSKALTVDSVFDIIVS